MPFTSEQSGRISLSGDLTFDSVTQVYEASQTALSGHSGDVDLAGILEVDSAGLALLLEWQAGSRAKGTRLSFINAPSDLKRLAALSGATELLGLSAP